jgi:signal peptidase
MRTGERKIFFIQILSLIILLFNSIMHEFLSEFGIIIFLMILLTLLAITCSIPRDNLFTGKQSMKLCLFYSIAFLILKYSLGLITGFYNNPYSLKFLDIVKNVVPVLIIIVLEEFCRFTINQRSGRNRFILVANILLFTFVDFALKNSFVDIRSLEPFLQLFTTTFMQCLFMNIGLTVISYKHGLKTALIYSCIFKLYGYIIPIIPGFSKYVETVVDMLIPIIIMVLLHIGVPDIFKKNKKNKEDIRNKHIVTKIIGVILFVLVIAMVSLNSNIFRFWVCVVGSGSMDPTIKIGDLIVVDKSYSKRYNELNNGDVIVFNISGKYYTHRIIEVIENNGEKSFITKGDREGQAIDDWLVTKNEIVGKTEFKFSYLGLPSIWLRDLVKEK